jgi:hydroxymethylpyrimidine pyrophosphatase-like HAD family hydrolase
VGGGLGLALGRPGALVSAGARRAAPHFRAVPREVGLSIAEQLRAAVPGTRFALEHPAGWASEADFPHHPDDRAGRTSGDFEEIFGDDVVKILAVHPDLEPEEFWRQVESVVGDQVVTTWSSSFALVEISAAGVDKATRLAALAEEMGVVAADVLAFGDMPNDLAMLGWAGTSYAMANAHPSVQALADHLAPSNDDDGVAVVLSDLFGLDR